MEFISDELDRYCCTHTTPESAVMRDLNRQTHLQVMQPRMLSGAFQGRLLTFIAQMIQPKNVLEIGTYTGYSALAFLEGMPQEGRLTTIDVNPELEDFVRSFFAQAGVQDRITWIIDDAQRILPTLQDTFDLVFIDADKKNYARYYDLAFDLVPSGGYFLIDNVLWSGKVMQPVKANDIDTQVIISFNDQIQNDERVENILLPIRDGLMLIRKK